jgi:hypothetical protein
MDFGPGSRNYLTVIGDEISIREVETGTVLNKLERPPSQTGHLTPWAIAFTPDQQRIYMSGHGFLYFWERSK